MSINVFDWHAHCTHILDVMDQQTRDYEQRIADLEFALACARDVNKDLHDQLEGCRKGIPPPTKEKDPTPPF